MQPVHTGFFRIILALWLLMRHVPPAGAAEFTVQSGFDVNDLDPGNGHCVAYLIISIPSVIPVCTLRAAIEETNQLPGPDTIQVPAGTFQLDIQGINEDNATTGDLDIIDSVHISGQGADKTFISGNNLDRVFDIIQPGAEVILENLTVLNGLLPQDLAEIQQGGGGIRNRGSLKLRNVAVQNNLVNGTAVGDVGGGVFNLAQCTLKNTTVTGNRAASGGGIYNATGALVNIRATTIHANNSLTGGGIANYGSLSLINTTVSGNRSISGSGGGVYNTFTADILQSTIAFNESPGPGGGLDNRGFLQAANTIIAGNRATNCFLDQPLFSLGNNIEDGNSCFLDSQGDLPGTDPKLDSLKDHGGPTLTHGLYIGSPAVDRGQDLSSMGITKDQRGISRPVGDEFDIGAFETKKRAVLPLVYPLLHKD